MEPLSTITQSIEKTDFLPSVLNPIGKEIGTALSNMLHVVFFPFNYAGERVRIYEQKQISKFVEEINTTAEDIPEENLVIPRLSTVGSAMENAKYCLDESDLRKMFATLIASSLDSQKQPYIRQSFAEIIKQLEPIDAQNLSYFAPFCVENFKTTTIAPPIQFPCVNYVAKKITTADKTLVLASNIFLSGQPNENYRIQSSSITNLLRLGLISCDYIAYFIDDSKYEIYRKLPEYLNLSKQLPSFKFDIQKGILTITPLGMDFIRTCVL